MTDRRRGLLTAALGFLRFRREPPEVASLLVMYLVFATSVY